MADTKALEREVLQINKRIHALKKEQSAAADALVKTYRSRRRTVDIDASFKIRPHAQKQNEQLAQIRTQLAAALSAEDARFEVMKKELRTDWQSRKDKLKSTLTQARAQVNSEFDQYSTETAKWIEDTKSQLVDEEKIALSTSQGEYMTRILDAETEMASKAAILKEQDALNSEADKKRKAESRKASDERRKDRQQQEKSRAKSKVRQPTQ